MSGEVICKIRPEEWELNRKQLELAALEAELTQRELDLATLQAELVLFQARYLNTLGELYSRLDALLARIAEQKAISHPEDKAARDEAAQARARATDSSNSTNSTNSAKAAGTAGAKRSYHFRPTKQLKKLYREVAKRIHPDLAATEKERLQYQKLMAEANRAYREGDELRLQALLHQGERTSETAREEYQVRLERLERRIGLIRERLKAIATDFAAVKHSTLYEMRLKVEEADRNGVDLLAEMAGYLTRQIARARAELAARCESHDEGLSA